jgi:hypothetical protein
MKTLISVLLLLVAALPAAWAALLVEVRVDQEQYLPGEALPVAVRITNRSGQTLHLGGEPDWLTFSVESRDSFIVSKTGEVPVVGEFTLETANVATKRVDLAPYFALTRPGRYRITATIRIKEWAALATSPPKDLAIEEGAKVWSREFGVPAAASANQPPELRRYSLLQVNSLRSEILLYFRLSDAAESKLMKVFPLGQIVSFGRPEAQVDGQNRLHVLQQNGAHTSLYTVITPAGEVVTRQLFDFAGIRAGLQLDREGNISVAGGTRRITRDDVPAPKSAEPESQAKTPEPKPTELESKPAKP